MAEYINKEALLKRRHGCKNDCSTCDFFLEEDSWCSGEVYVLDILRIPAADVQPVVHGRWINTMPIVEYKSFCQVKCSICESIEPYGNFCRNCGADMRGE